jgi:hypothetical protein
VILKADPQTPPPGMRSIPPKRVPKPELGNESSNPFGIEAAKFSRFVIDFLPALVVEKEFA